MVVHNKVREKLAELPPDVEYIAAEDVPDTWNCYPWDAASYGRDIFAHEALARECLGREEKKDNEKKEKKEKKKKEEEEEENKKKDGAPGPRLAADDSSPFLNPKFAICIVSLVVGFGLGALYNRRSTDK